MRIFATDLDIEAISYARRGVYPATALAAGPPDMVDRYFTRNGDDLEGREFVRAMMVFGQHDLGQRAPFPRIDLALCRNVLISFTPEPRKRALQLFAFSLREGGYLVLGKAESTLPLAGHRGASVGVGGRVLRRVARPAPCGPRPRRARAPSGERRWMISEWSWSPRR